ncbi:thioesterase [Pseudenhygromyxa sp. WMMC2535]|uniref:MaoC/PaaZ C-terminal domain-containing protein n=1 Tax=Pseudenhygromyxa sp. WMMC2535 TaxID=2712867 RepID=UPI0015542A02|nr:MaoC/PaaZ C-terminal domain-containing protein [Pseudenhygromyxa sp. WMMC2535]NVB37134.1 thioesterase [Pseudenhygromyxa sp. WMMC2535]
MSDAPPSHTHLAIDHSLCGEPRQIEPGRRAVVELHTEARMAADARGLVHGGFVFGAADYAAMLAVDDPNVVLGSAEVRFTAPVRVGERVELRAEVEGEKARKREVSVRARVSAKLVFEGRFVCFVLDHHVLEDA